MANQSSDTLFAFDQDKERPNCLLAVPKKGRLYDQVMKLLLGAGLEHHRPNRLDVAHCKGLPLTIVFLPASDIASYVGEGNVDAGITGIDVVEESQVEVERVLDLGFGKCKLCLQAPISSEIKSPHEMAGKRVVTSFPNIARKYFDSLGDLGKATKIKYVSGSVEAACGLGLADAIVDLVETGTTMKAAGLEVVSDIITTEAVMISSKTSAHPQIVELIKKRIQGFLTATNYMMIQYNISKELLHLAVKITPGKRSPTVTKLEDGIAVAVSALVLTSQSSVIMDQLQGVGATDILLFSISNSRM